MDNGRRAGPVDPGPGRARPNGHLAAGDGRKIARRLLTPSGADRHLAGLGFRLEVWSPDGRGFLELLAATQSYQLIKLVFDAALKTRPGGRLVVRQGIRVVLDSGPPDPDGAGNVVRLPTARTGRAR